MSKHILAIDPGNPFGWATFYNNGLTGFGECCGTGETWLIRTLRNARSFATVLESLKPDAVYCEIPTYMDGHAAAAGGSLVKLSIVFGTFLQVCNEHGVQLIPVEVRDWMGQLSAKAIRHRVESIVGPVQGNHTIDAVGIGLHALGLWPG